MAIWLGRDLTETRRAELKVAAMQRELVATSRMAGMSQLATSVLHNVRGLPASMAPFCTTSSAVSGGGTNTSTRDAGPRSACRVRATAR